MRECQCPECGHRFTPGLDPTWVESVVKLRKGIGMSQRELARRLGLSPQYINDIEGLRRLAPRPELQDAWERAVGWTHGTPESDT